MIDNRRASECSIVNEPAVSIGKGILFSFRQLWEQDHDVHGIRRTGREGI